ncbi:GNAT family N-acetyltransferase (plasmid) [Haloimpatiens sp. FM7330]|uniref:GNAT family N-acetyltransferase n=1 Tax=Haloimpatiens sp. FM7330 TaxID=3298610 RepID=UPI0036367C28
MSEILLESKRMILKSLEETDFYELCKMLKDIEVMYAWEKVYNDEEIYDWIKRMKKSYAENKHGYCLAIDKNTKETIGQIGLLKEKINGKNYTAVGYILKKEYWGKGYATEGAEACIRYAFNNLNVKEVVTDIRPENVASINVAKNIGMHLVGEYVKEFKGMKMKHLVYKIQK